MRIPKSKFRNLLGGGVWESNPPEHALTYSQTVLKTAPITGKDAPPLILGYEFNRPKSQAKTLAILAEEKCH